MSLGKAGRMRPRRHGKEPDPVESPCPAKQCKDEADSPSIALPCGRASRGLKGCLWDVSAMSSAHKGRTEAPVPGPRLSWSGSGELPLSRAARSAGGRGGDLRGRHAQRGGALPRERLLALAQVENAAAVEDAVARYQAVLGPEVALPTETLAELLALHPAAFMARAFKDDMRQFQGKLMRRLEQQKEELCQRNERASLQRCQAVLAEVSHDLDAHICNGAYAVPGGYQCFLGDQGEMLERYRQVPGKGIKAGKALVDFLASKEPAAKVILRTDEALAEKEKEVEAQHARAEAAAREQELLWQEKAELQQKPEEQRRSHEEHVRQLMDNLEKEREAQLEELNWTVEQEVLLRERFQEESSGMEGALHQLQEESPARSRPSGVSTVLGRLGELLSHTLGGVMDKGVGLGTRLLERF
ncbi:LOW QUALITY PROTEIN: guanylate-binding protein 1-like [Alligator sinensis]|uniref:LOW QUALITY PROTEIN: guanylate-binding protein 1-like n=1 Tax=Alligator sinensis TaxID=38654 RepID=A0A3Q0H7Y0_ALLSI|nr:LOW QUALITY PROTEIN: guanylate-binding protein 1-like [Alligator sinensis]